VSEWYTPLPEGGASTVDNGLLALKLVLEGLGVEASVDDFDKRLMMQKAVYLGQRLGVDLGYRFSWYRRGPYSSALADDYFRLCSAGEQSADDRKLHPKVAERLEAAQRLLVPKDEMEPPDWAELVASLDYLLKVDGYEFQNAKKVLQDTKPELAEAADDARKRLEEAGLVVRVGKQWLTAPT
jgi:hypothetical protein